MRRALLAFGAIGLLVAPVCINEPIAAFADGSDPEATSTISRYESEETSSSVIEASSGVVSEGAGDPEEAWYDRAFEWVDNKVVPLFGASTLTAIISFVASVALAIAKRRGDKRNGALIKSQADDMMVEIEDYFMHGLKNHSGEVCSETTVEIEITQE